MAALAILGIMLGCAAYQYFKGTVVTAFAAIINAVISSFIAFAFFELLSEYLAKYLSSVAGWGPAICFGFVFLLVFAVLQAVLPKLIRHKVDLGLRPERIGRPICGIVLGYIISGVMLTAGAIAPLPNSYPYPRFDQRNPNPERPNKVALNADGFVTGLFSLASNGSFSSIANKRSFAALHAQFLDQLYLNRHSIAEGVPAAAASDAIEVPAKNAAWYAPETMRDSEGKPISPGPGRSLILVRMGIRRNALPAAGRFTLSQLRLICRPKNAKTPLSGKGYSIYPVGYLTGPNQLQMRRFNEKTEIQDFPESVKWTDFGFYVPSDLMPVLVEFKLNNIAQVPPPVSAEQAPGFESFAQPASTSREPEPGNSAQSEPPTAPSESREKPARRGGLSNISRSVVGDQLDENQ